MIPRVSIPRARYILRRVVSEPLWDTEYMARGSDRPMEFFQHCVGDPFGVPEVARAILGESRSFKTRSDTSVQRKDGCPLLSQDRYLLSRVVLYPSTEGVKDLSAYHAAVERLRQTATLEVCFGPQVHCSFPLRDAMPNIECGLPTDHDHSVDSRGFDPSEAPDLTYRVGVDVEVHLAAPGDAEARSARKDDHPIHILTKEDFRVRVVPHSGGEDVGIRCYLVGTHARAVNG